MEDAIEELVGAVSEEAVRRARRDAAAGRAGHHPQAGEGPHRRRSRRSPTITSRSSASILDKIKEIMPTDELDEVQRRCWQAADGARPSAPALPAYWTVEEDPRAAEGEELHPDQRRPERPEKDKPVQPGWPFQPAASRFPRRPARGFVDWLTAPENPLFARVAVNRLWQWHFGEGIAELAERLRHAGRDAEQPELLDWLASEFVAHNFSMKEMHRLIVTSDTYKLVSKAEPALLAANTKIDPRNTYLWHFRLQRLEAEPIWDSIHDAAGDLDLSVGGQSFELREAGSRRETADADRRSDSSPMHAANRRGVYMIRGYFQARDVMPNFLQAFDVDDGRAPCPCARRPSPRRRRCS